MHSCRRTVLIFHGVATGRARPKVKEEGRWGGEKISGYGGISMEVPDTPFAKFQKVLFLSDLNFVLSWLSCM